MDALLALEQAAAVVARLLPDDPALRDEIAQAWAVAPPCCINTPQRTKWRQCWLEWVEGAGDTWPYAESAFEAPDPAHDAVIAWACASAPAAAATAANGPCPEPTIENTAL